MEESFYGELHILFQWPRNQAGFAALITVSEGQIRLINQLKVSLLSNY